MKTETKSNSRKNANNYHNSIDSSNNVNYKNLPTLKRTNSSNINNNNNNKCCSNNNQCVMHKHKIQTTHNNNAINITAKGKIEKNSSNSSNNSNNSNSSSNNCNGISGSNFNVSNENYTVNNNNNNYNNNTNTKKKSNHKHNKRNLRDSISELPTFNSISSRIMRCRTNVISRSAKYGKTYKGVKTSTNTTNIQFYSNKSSNSNSNNNNAYTYNNNNNNKNSRKKHCLKLSWFTSCFTSFITSVAVRTSARILTLFLVSLTFLSAATNTTSAAIAVVAITATATASLTTTTITAMQDNLLGVAILSGNNTTGFNDSLSGNTSANLWDLNSLNGVSDVDGLSVSISGNGVVRLNTTNDSTEHKSEYIFDRTDVRIIFITLYTLVFCCCFFGNLLVILVVTLSRRLRSITNFFLANLALADFCVGLFCVMQNLSIYLIDSWVFGEFLCRMYQFVHSLSYTASIFILVVICMERYFAIVHPITCKQILTAARLRMVILTVWITSAVYSTPKFVFSKTIKNIHTEDGQEEEICVLDRKMFNSKLLDMINFVLLYVIPLLVMTVLYSKIAIALWRSSRGLSHHVAQQEDNSMSMHNSMYHHHHHHHGHHHHTHQIQQHQQQHQPQQQTQQQQQQQQQQQLQPGTPTSGSSAGVLSRKQSSKYEKRGVSITESQVSLDAERPIVSACRKTSFYHHSHQHQQRHGTQRVAHMSYPSSNVLRARRGVVRMLIIFVLTFALCNLPYHARKMWQYWSRSYRGDSNFNALLTPLTFLVTYFNSGVNPLLYAFLSRNFRKGMKELCMCSWKKGKSKSSSNSSMHHKRIALQTHSLPTDTTHIGNEQL